MDLRKHLLEAVTLIAAAVLCALVANAVASRERKIVLVGTYPNATKVPPPPPPTPTTAALRAGGALLLDARRTSISAQGHIAGARPFSVGESDADDKVRALWDQRQDPKEQALPIVVYCSGGDCEDSHMLAQKLWGAQFN